MLRRPSGESLLQARTVLQAVFLLALAAAGIWVVAKVSEGWADWVVFAVIVLTVIGAARAVFFRKYPTKKRTFVRHAEPDTPPTVRPAPPPE
jgi:membrane protein implicated in regulation of membrane protease activity